MTEIFSIKKVGFWGGVWSFYFVLFVYLNYTDQVNLLYFTNKFLPQFNGGKVEVLITKC